jgi:phage terminase small subunit
VRRNPATSGLLVKRADGNPAANPLLGIARKAAADMVHLAGHFGMSPVARARISAGVGYEPPPGSKFDGLLG